MREETHRPEEALSTGNRSRPLIPDDAEEHDGNAYEYNEYGSLVRTEPAAEAESRPTLSALDGSWYVRLTQRREAEGRPAAIHGAMRIESRTSNWVLVSGDVYTEEYGVEGGRSTDPMPENPLTIGRNWYPQFPAEKYGWYFRSRGIRYEGRTLSVDLERHVWDQRADDFETTESGSMTLRSRPIPFTHPSLPQPTVRMRGTATFGGTKYDAVATKTSPYYRGCLIEADVMTNRRWAGTAQRPGGLELSFSGVYRDAGLEFHAEVDEVDVPEDAELTLAELQQLLATHRDPAAASGRGWHLWLVVASQLGGRGRGTLGIMFDDVEPYREGAAAFYDPRFGDSSIVHPSARGKAIGEVPLAILRTALHEIGHAFNLYHPKHDAHTVPIGTTIMNQTGDVMGFASETNPYPDNATFSFDDHNHASLVHAADPQVKPGWKTFGYGHGGIGNAPDEPSDLTFDRDTPEAADVEFDLGLPRELFPGELPIATASVRNVGDGPVETTTALNLEEDYLRLVVKRPRGERVEVRDLLLVCSDRRTVVLEPGEVHTGHFQLLYTNRGYVFERPGRYTVTAELDLGDRVARSDPIDVHVRSPMTEAEADLSVRGLDREVGRSVALGYPPVDQDTANEKLETLAEEFPDTDLGTAAAFVLAQDRSHDVRDYRRDGLLHGADEEAADRYLDVATEDYDPEQLIRIATAVVPAGERDAPLLDRLLEGFEADGSEGVERARSWLEDFRAYGDEDTGLGLE